MRHRSRIAVTRSSIILFSFLALILPFMSCCMSSRVRPIPTSKELFKKYDFQEGDLKYIAFYLSNRLVLKTEQVNSTYRRKDDFLELEDDRLDEVFSLSVNDRGKFAEKRVRTGKTIFTLKPPFIGNEKQELISVQFNIRGMGQVDLEFVENREGFFELAKDARGKISVGGKTFTCLDGCKSLLMFKAREDDYYDGIDHSPSYCCLKDPICLAILAIVASIFLYGMIVP